MLETKCSLSPLYLSFLFKTIEAESKWGTRRLTIGFLGWDMFTFVSFPSNIQWIQTKLMTMYTICRSPCIGWLDVIVVVVVVVVVGNHFPLLTNQNTQTYTILNSSLPIPFPFDVLWKFLDCLSSIIVFVFILNSFYMTKH